MANKRAKLSDIAREAGVSLTAASFYINGKAKQYKLSPATCERLEAAVRKYDYVPNLFARAMQQNRTFLIGLLVRDRINSSFWSDIIAGIENGIAASGCHLVLAGSHVDAAGELDAIRQMRAKDVPEEEALDYVLGYTCLNDITARDVQKADGQWARGKNMDGFAPMGPVVTDEVDPEHLTITTRLNGQVVQQGRTEQLITGVRALISFITASMTLEPGDVIATGTPAGVGPMQPGDTVEVEVSGIGILCNTIV